MRKSIMNSLRAACVTAGAVGAALLAPLHSSFAQQAFNIQIDKVVHHASMSPARPGVPSVYTSGASMTGTSSALAAAAHVWGWNGRQWVSLPVRNFSITPSAADTSLYGGGTVFRYYLHAETAGAHSFQYFDVDLLVNGRWVKMSANGQPIVASRGDGMMVKKIF